MKRYQDIYPSHPLLNSAEVERVSASDLLSLEYFEAEPASMPTAVFAQHHILINLNENDHRVENWREGHHREFTFRKNEIVITPAGIESGWRWHAKSKVIVITLDPQKLEKFALHEIGVVLKDDQLQNVPLLEDTDLVAAASLVYEALKSQDVGFDVVFESLSRVFLVKLIQKYGAFESSDSKFDRGFSTAQYKKVLNFVKGNFGESIELDQLAKVAGMSRFHFSRSFKETIGRTPTQFVLEFRAQQAKKMLSNRDMSLSEIAARCGFSDQAHFSRTFKAIYGKSPKFFR